MADIKGSVNVYVSVGLRILYVVSNVDFSHGYGWCVLCEKIHSVHVEGTYIEGDVSLDVNDVNPHEVHSKVAVSILKAGSNVVRHGL